jgi:hypothetical protein
MDLIPMLRKLTIAALLTLVAALPATAQQADKHRGHNDNDNGRTVWPSDIVTKRHKADGTCYVVSRDG